MHLWLSTSVDTMAAAAAAAELLARYDEKLVAKGLPKNETMVEGSPFTAKESEVLAACRKECGAAAIDSFSSTWVDRMVRGMYTNNKGSHEARLKETMESFKTISAWRRKVGADGLVKRALPGAEVVNAKARATMGGTDYYGHCVVVEQLDGIGDLCGCGLSVEEMLLVRAQQAEALDSEKVRVSEALGAVRYKQVYVLDLGVLSLGTLMRRNDVRNLTTKVLEVGQKYYPEGMWKIFVVNAPWIFRSVYALFTPFIHPVTRDKIKILGGPKAFLAELEKVGVTRDAVPRCVGGGHPGTDIMTILRRHQGGDALGAEETKEEPRPPSEMPAGEAGGGGCPERTASLVAVLGSDADEVTHVVPPGERKEDHGELLPPIPEQAQSPPDPAAGGKDTSFMFFLCGCENSDKANDKPPADAVPATPPKAAPKHVEIRVEAPTTDAPASQGQTAAPPSPSRLKFKVFNSNKEMLPEDETDVPAPPLSAEALRTLEGDAKAAAKKAPATGPVGDAKIAAMIASAATGGAAAAPRADHRPKAISASEGLVLAAAVLGAVLVVRLVNWAQGQ